MPSYFSFKLTIMKLPIIIFTVFFLFSFIEINSAIPNLSIAEKSPRKIVFVEISVDLDSALRYIRKHEGLRLKPYVCAGGKKTIGYGHVIKPNESFGNITKQQAEDILLQDWVDALQCVVGEPISPEHYTPVAHFIYCLGVGTWKRSSVRKYLILAHKAQDAKKRKYYLQKARTYCLKYSHIKGKFYPSLQRTRLWEASQF